MGRPPPFPPRTAAGGARLRRAGPRRLRDVSSPARAFHFRGRRVGAVAAGGFPRDRHRHPARDRRGAAAGRRGVGGARRRALRKGDRRARGGAGARGDDGGHDLRRRLADQSHRDDAVRDEAGRARARSNSKRRSRGICRSSPARARRRSPCGNCSRTPPGCRRASRTSRRSDGLRGRHRAGVRGIRSATRRARSFRYSDINFILLGEIVRRVSGQPLDEYCRGGNLRARSAMKDTGFRPAAELRARIAPTDARRRERGVVHDPTARRMGGVAGHAGLFTTAADLARFARMLLGGGELDGVRVFKPETVELMTTRANARRRRRRGAASAGTSTRRLRRAARRVVSRSAATGTPAGPAPRCGSIRSRRRSSSSSRTAITRPKPATCSPLRRSLGTLAAESRARVQFPPRPRRARVRGPAARRAGGPSTRRRAPRCSRASTCWCATSSRRCAG